MSKTDHRLLISTGGFVALCILLVVLAPVLTGAPGFDYDGSTGDPDGHITRYGEAVEKLRFWYIGVLGIYLLGAAAFVRRGPD